MRTKGIRQALVCKALQDHGPMSLVDIKLTVEFMAWSVVNSLQLTSVVKRVDGKYALIRMPESVDRVLPGSGAEKILVALKQSRMTAKELATMLADDLTRHSVNIALDRMRKKGLVTRAKVPGKPYVWERA